MALYAYDENDLIAAWDAPLGGRYWCVECQMPVKVRRGRTPHFYHLKLSPSCRLYSKSEDHLLLQLEIQNFFPKEEVQIERLFSEIKRVSDVVWEKKKIAFEIQCSMIYPKEAKRRVAEYKSLGYQVIWILDDRAFNKKILRPSEPYLREHHGYYVSFRRHTPSLFYDQFELWGQKERVYKSRKLSIDLRRPILLPDIPFSESWPLQILNRGAHASLYLFGDLFHRALQASIDLSTAVLIEHWKMVEECYRPRRFIWLDKILGPLVERLDDFLTEKR